MKHLFVAGMATSLCAAVPAGAEQAPDAARMAAAEHLLQSMHYDSQIDRTVEVIIGDVERSIHIELNKKLDQPLPPEVPTRIKGIAEAHMRQTSTDHRSELRRGAALIYAHHFTVAELDRMAALQSDPVMVKMPSELPQIMAETMALSQATIAGSQEQMQKDVRAVVEHYLLNKDQTPSSYAERIFSLRIKC